MKKPSKNTKFWIFYHVGMIAFAAVVAMIMKVQQVGDPFTPTVLVPFFTLSLLFVCGGYLAVFMINRGKNYPHDQLTKKIVPALLIFYIAIFLIANISISLGVLGWFLFTGQNLNQLWDQLIHHELNFANNRLFIWLMFFSIAFFYVLWQKSTKKEQLLSEEKLRFQYNNLKAQVNPHFLFNSLNTLSELVYQDAKKADNYIQKLSAIYRYILENENTALISLDKEIDFVKEFFSLQKERDDDKIELEINLGKTTNLSVVPVSLQVLVENALKHNACSKNSPLKIKITREDDYVIVSNNIQRKSLPENSTRIGLQNLMERVKLATNKELIQKEENHEFIVKIPLIQTL
jgi:two-component system, LytTR family, sensor kinase